MATNPQDLPDLSFDLPKNQSNVIKVIGVGGGGSNAINHMFQQGIKGVDFLICNTDAQALESSPVPNKIQLGMHLTEGLGAGANPQIGEQAAVESMEEIRNMLMKHTKMVFITAGMGGGTGTGAAPIIAKMAQELDILTVGIVTIPFQFEGKLRNEQAEIGVEKLRKNVDSLIVINNNKLREVYGNLGYKTGFSKADEVLATAAKGIAEVITYHYMQNIDLRDARTVLSKSGTAIMGSAVATGKNRAQEAIVSALDSPLLNDNKIRGAKNVLLLIVSGKEEITIDEIGEINDYIQEEAGHSANIIMGVGEDVELENDISITIIATGFNPEQQDEMAHTEVRKIIHTLEDEQPAQQVLHTNKQAQPLVNNVPATEAPVHKTVTPENTLFSETAVNEPTPFEGYIPTSELIKQLPIVFETIPTSVETQTEVADGDMLEKQTINDIEISDFVIVSAETTPETPENTVESEATIEADTPENQILMFDMPLPEDKKTIAEMEVKDPTHVIPVAEVTEDGVKRYSLDDYEALETTFSEAAPNQSKSEIAEPEEAALQFTTKVVTDTELASTPQPIKLDVTKEDTHFSEEDSVQDTSNKEVGEKEDTVKKEVDPLHSPISKLIESRAEERKRKMKTFNYKFRNNSAHLNELESEPAYKRHGVQLDDVASSDSQNLSRTSLHTEEGEIDFKKNNSFLHDNVD